MFDVLDTCWIVIYCISVCLYMFWMLLGRRDRQNKKFFKTDEHKGHVERAWLAGLPHGLYIHQGTDKHTANMATGRAQADVAYVHWPCATDECVTDEHKICLLVPTNMCPYVCLVMFHYYIR
jgi:hypothetical protein